MTLKEKASVILIYFAIALFVIQVAYFFITGDLLWDTVRGYS